MKKIIIHLLCVIAFGNSIAIHAQQSQSDTIILMNYNVGNYGFPATSNCPLLNTSIKHGYLRTVLNYVHPDIIGLMKMNAYQSFCNDSVIHFVMDSVCNGCYGHGVFTNVSGYSKENMIYYNTNKIGFISTTTIYGGDPNISDINLHKLFYKSPALSITHDTIFLNIILVHDKSGSGNASQRATEIAGAMSWLNSHVTTPGNYVFMGDFNTQSSNEACFQDMVNASNINIRFIDPVNQPGDWGNNPTAFANYLTQSTRTTDPGDCNSTGGMDNRFDMILCTQPIMDGTDSVKYIPDTCNVLGQDGNHTNLAIIDAPTNTSVPANVLNALYYMSEHLPVVMDLQVNYSIPLGIKDAPKPTITFDFNNIITENLSIKTMVNESFQNDKTISVLIYDTKGRLLFQDSINSKETKIISMSNFASGIYFLTFMQGNVPLSHGKLVKISE